MVPLLLLGDLFALGYYRQHADWALIRRLVPGVLLGFAITAVLFRFLPVSTLGRIIGVLILASVGLEVWRRWSERHEPTTSSSPCARARGILFFGSLAGMTTMAANAGGTAMTLYLVKMRVSMLAFMGTSAWFFFVLNVIKVPGHRRPRLHHAGDASSRTCGCRRSSWSARSWASRSFRRMNEQVFTDDRPDPQRPRRGVADRARLRLVDCGHDGSEQ